MSREHPSAAPSASRADDFRPFGNPSALAENRLFYWFADQGLADLYYRTVLFSEACPQRVREAMTPGQKRLFDRVCRHQRRRRENLGRFIRALDAPGLWLDLGCGNGQFLDRILENPDHGAVGTELDLEQLATARRMLAGRPGQKRLSLVVQEEAGLPFRDGSFDYVFSADVMEHVGYSRQGAILQEIRRVLRTGGVFVLHTPNGNRVRLTTLYKKLRYGLAGYNPRDIRHSYYEGHRSLVSAGTLGRLARRSGFEISVHFQGEKVLDTVAARVPAVADWIARSFVLVGKKHD